jgi:PKHD-type hydroxylase
MHVSAILPPQQKETPPYVWFNRLFSAPECAELIRVGEASALEPGKIGAGDPDTIIVNPDYRQVLTCALMDHQVPWAYERLRDKATLANGDYFRYDLSGLHEHLVFLRYDFDPEKPGKYEWHQDIGGAMSSLRKLSTVTQLSDPFDYEGCRLHMFSNRDFDPGHVERGDTMIFPSYLPHCVTPIMRGRRYSLVSWITGPAFR